MNQQLIPPGIYSEFNTPLHFLSFKIPANLLEKVVQIPSLSSNFYYTYIPRSLGWKFQIKNVLILFNFLLQLLIEFALYCRNSKICPRTPSNPLCDLQINS